MAKIQRRSILEGIGAAAIGAAAYEIGRTGSGAPAKAGVSTYRLNLICHGMMLFRFNKDTTSDFTILIPSPPKYNGDYLHKVSLTTKAGGITPADGNLLGDASTDRYRIGNWLLSLNSAAGFSRAQSNFHKTDAPEADKDAVFWDAKNPANRLTTNGTPGDANSPIAIYLRVPYPTDVVAYRKMAFSKGQYPYDLSTQHTAKDFSIMPASMATIHVFSYANVTSPITLTLPDGTTDTIAVPNQGWLNLHLYSEPDKGAYYQYGDQHIAAFNSMFSYGPQGANKFDLKASGHHPDHPYGNGYPLVREIDEELSVEDLKSLAEINNPQAMDDLINQMDSKPSVNGNKAYEPVDCLQGWGT